MTVLLTRACFYIKPFYHLHGKNSLPKVRFLQ